MKHYREPGPGYEAGIIIRDVIGAVAFLARKVFTLAAVACVMLAPAYIAERAIPELWNSLPPTLTHIFRCS